MCDRGILVMDYSRKPEFKETAGVITGFLAELLEIIAKCLLIISEWTLLSHVLMHIPYIENRNLLISL